MEFCYNKKEEGLEDVSAAMLLKINSVSKDVKEELYADMSELERTGFAYLTTLGVKIFEEYALKRLVPKRHRSSEVVCDIFYDGAKKFLLMQEFHKLSAIIMDLEGQNSDTLTINFRGTDYENYDYVTYAYAIAYLRTQGWVFDWKSFDSQNMSLTSLGECKFKKAEPVSGKELIESTALVLESKIQGLNIVPRWENNITRDSEIKEEHTFRQ